MPYCIIMTQKWAPGERYFSTSDSDVCHVARCPVQGNNLERSHVCRLGRAETFPHVAKHRARMYAVHWDITGKFHEIEVVGNISWLPRLLLFHQIGIFCQVASFLWSGAVAIYGYPDRGNILFAVIWSVELDIAHLDSVKSKFGGIEKRFILWKCMQRWTCERADKVGRVKTLDSGNLALMAEKKWKRALRSIGFVHVSGTFVTVCYQVWMVLWDVLTAVIFMGRCLVRGRWLLVGGS